MATAQDFYAGKGCVQSRLGPALEALGRRHPVAHCRERFPTAPWARRLWSLVGMWAATCMHRRCAEVDSVAWWPVQLPDRASNSALIRQPWMLPAGSVRVHAWLIEGITACR